MQSIEKKLMEALQPALQQTPCSTLRERLVQWLNEEQQYYDTHYMNQPTMIMAASRMGTLRQVIQMIDEMSPVA